MKKTAYGVEMSDPELFIHRGRKRTLKYNRHFFMKGDEPRHAISCN